MKTSDLPLVAYFSMEYGLHDDLKLYSGGLGILAGDFIKGARQYNYPMVAIGIRWKQGYTDQRIDEQGNVYDAYHTYSYDTLEDTGVRVEITIRKTPVKCKVWKTEAYNNIPLYLLDTDLEENADRWITGQLYGWFGEERIAQELVLGAGGIKALRALGIEPDVYHFNEGHALFAGFELIREKREQGMELNDALVKTQDEVVFTTHTPVIQGNESHPIDRLMYMGANLGLTRTQLKELGGSPFNMTVGALRLARNSNAVAQLHGETANKMWAHIENRSEIIAITNAIHAKTWVDLSLWDAVDHDEKLWETHMKNKLNLISFVKQRNEIDLDPNKLIIGFSRRAAPYKRSDLIFTDPNRIEPLLKDQKVQIIFSGKAHPLDDNGKKIVSNLVAISKKYPDSVVFLQNYGMEIGRMLTRGSDVWLNNPRRPKEASGTSGMKAAMNGVLNFSILDGWWPEACEHGVNGWQFGNGYESDDEKELDKHDLQALYNVLENEVLPTFYNDRKKWIEMMRNSIVSTQKEFEVKRMLEEYYERLYMA
jgi:starch phosphorylase